MPLNIFEPRYLAMVDRAMSGDRVVGILQPRQSEDDAESPEGKSVELRRVGTLGRITSYAEADDGRFLVTLTGICRFALRDEIASREPFRSVVGSFESFAVDLERGAGEDDVDRQRLLKVLKTFLEAQDLKADWSSINRSPNEFLVNTLSMISPYGPEEKQALLEAADLKTRAEVLVALAEMQLAARNDDSGTALQ